MTEIEQLRSEKSFLEGKRYFHYANHPYLFKLLEKYEKRDYQVKEEGSIQVAACTSELFQIVYRPGQAAYYLINGEMGLRSPEKLKHPLRLASTLPELFETDDFLTRLIASEDEEYDSWVRDSYEESEESITGVVPKAVFPNKDMRIFYKEKYPLGYFTDHKEHNSKRLEDFIKRVNLEKYLDINTFFDTKPYFEIFMEIMDRANKDLDSPNFLYVEFYQSGYQGIISISDLDDETLTTFLKYGLVYNKLDVPERIYERLE